MTEATLILRVDSALKAEFFSAAKARGCTAAELLCDFMSDFVHQQQEATGYEAWFRSEVAKGIAEADVGDVIASADVEARFAKRREALRRRLARSG